MGKKYSSPRWDLSDNPTADTEAKKESQVTSEDNEVINLNWIRLRRTFPYGSYSWHLRATVILSYLSRLPCRHENSSSLISLIMESDLSYPYLISFVNQPSLDWKNFPRNWLTDFSFLFFFGRIYRENAAARNKGQKLNHKLLIKTEEEKAKRSLGFPTFCAISNGTLFFRIACGNNELEFFSCVRVGRGLSFLFSKFSTGLEQRMTNFNSKHFRVCALESFEKARRFFRESGTTARTGEGRREHGRRNQITVTSTTH